MNIKQLETEWAKDSQINELRLSDESLKIPSLHHKYYQLYVREKLSYTKLKEKEKKLEYILTYFYSKQLTDEELEEHGLVYDDKKVLKPDIPKAIAAHDKMISLKIEMSMHWEKAEYLKSILSMISSRSFQIRDAIEFIKYQNGVG